MLLLPVPASPRIANFDHIVANFSGFLIAQSQYIRMAICGI
jgi:hypothetical protein